MTGMKLIDDLKTPCGCGLFTSVSLLGIILVTIGLLGMFRAWGPLDIFTMIFGIGIFFAGVSILTLLFAAIECCFD
jgi:hypothetical protein